MTAAIAVLALSSTPALAQAVADAPVASPAPVLVVPPPVSTPAAATPSAPSIAPAALFAITPSDPVDDEPAAAASPVARKKASIVSTARVATPRAVTPAPAQAAAAPARPVETVATKAPAAATAPAAQTVAKPAPAPDSRVTTTSTSTDTNDVLPMAGAGLAALLLAGGAFALGRKRREDEPAEDEVVHEHATPALAADVAMPAPVTARVASPRQETTDALPVGFDLSRFGPHVQAAYRGPSEDNPSYSLRKRLRRARFMDQRERAGSAPAMSPARETTPVAAAAAPTPDRKRDPKLVWSNAAPKATFRPAFQS